MERQAQPCLREARGWTAWFLHQANYKGKRQQKKEKGLRRGQARGTDTSEHRGPRQHKVDMQFSSMWDPYPKNLRCLCGNRFNSWASLRTTGGSGARHKGGETVQLTALLRSGVETASDI